MHEDEDECNYFLVWAQHTSLHNLLGYIFVFFQVLCWGGGGMGSSGGLRWKSTIVKYRSIRDNNNSI